jgi:GAF domain-containing protein
MEFGFVSEFVGEELILRSVSGDADSFDMSDGDGYPLEGTYCQRMVSGRIPKVIPSTAENEELRDLAMTKLSGIGAYVGVPILLSSGKLYGSLAVFSHRPQRNLGPRQLQLLEVLARIIASGIEQQSLEKENERLRARIAGMSDELDEAESDRRLSRILLSGEFQTIPRGTPPPK